VSEDAGNGTQATEDGIESLRTAADRQLGKRGSNIAEALGKKAAEGDLNSAKFLVSVAEKKGRKRAKTKRRDPSVEDQLALEPQWEEPPEAPSELDDGNGKPEA
jgi:hypothetical protein